jgi:hypothetical protein
MIQNGLNVFADRISFIHSCLRAKYASKHSRLTVICKMTPHSLTAAIVWYDLSTEIQILLLKNHGRN